MNTIPLNNVADQLKDTKNIPVSFAFCEEISEKISETDTQEMPLHLLPGAVQEIIEATNKALNYPKEYMAASMLFAASVAIGTTCRAVVKEGWKESAVIFLCMVGNPGIGKTPPLMAATEPLREIDAASYSQYRVNVAAVKANEKLPKDQKDHNMQTPVWCKYLLTDATPEALAGKHMDNLRGVGYCVDELAAWFKNFNRYSSGSEQEMWLSTFSGTPVNIDRKTSEPIYIRHPFISVAGTIQPGILPAMAGEDRDNNGFLDRILFVHPEGVKKEYWTDNKLNPEISDRWTGMVHKLLALTAATTDNGEEYPNYLRFTEDAYTILIDWQRKNTDRCNDDESYASIGAKIEIYAIRLSLIMQGLFFAAEGHTMHGISAKAVTAAIGFADYFAGQALKVRGAITGSDPLAMLTGQTRKYYESLPGTFTTREAVNIAENMEINERTARRFLESSKKLFKKFRRGVWEKV